MRLICKTAPGSPFNSDPASLPCCGTDALVGRALHRFILLTCGATLLLVIAGGLVTSKGVGMAVPDWPNSYGYNMFCFPPSKWVGGIFYEHTHRLIASMVGLMTSVVAIWLYGRKAHTFLKWTGGVLLMLGIATLLSSSARRADGIVALVTGLAGLLSSFVWPRSEPAPKWLRGLGLAAFFAVVLQGVLGGLRVVLFKDEIGIFHALLAQMFFGLLCAMALVTSSWWPKRLEVARVLPASTSRWVFIIPTLMILCQLALGAAMRHQHAGLAIPDFPLAYGKVWPAMDAASVEAYNQHRIEVMSANPITAGQIWLQMLHRLLAVGILGAVALAAIKVRKSQDSALKNFSVVWLMLILLQVLLGAATIWSNKAADVATVHVLIGALSLVTGILACTLSLSWRPSLRRTMNVRASISLVPQPAPVTGT